MKKTFFITMIIAGAALFSGCAVTPEARIDMSAIPMPEPLLEARTPGSLWQGQNSRNRYFTDFRARDVGDIITVTVLDRTTAKEEATTSTGTSSSEETALTDIFGLPLNLGMSNLAKMGNPFSPSIAGSRENEFEGTGSTERKGEITATVSVRVMKIFSNGNLYVEGRKQTKVNREERYVTLAGIVRPEDISSINTISSDKIADLRVELSGYGVVSNKQKPGWLTGILDGAWPF